GARERLRVRVPRPPAEQPLRLRDVDERVAVGGLVMPLCKWREASQLERAEGKLGWADRDWPEPASRSRVLDQRLEVDADRAELARADVECLTGDARGFGCEDEHVDEILDREQLIAVGAVAPCTSTSAPWARRRAAAGSRMSPRTSSTARSSSGSSSGATSSERTAWPSASSRRARWRPRKPAPPEIAQSMRSRYWLRTGSVPRVVGGYVGGGWLD